MTRAADAFAVARASLYRAGHPAVGPAPRPASPRALTAGERQGVLDVLHSERFVDLAPKRAARPTGSARSSPASWQTSSRFAANPLQDVQALGAVHLVTKAGRRYDIRLGDIQSSRGGLIPRVHRHR